MHNICKICDSIIEHKKEIYMQIKLYWDNIDLSSIMHQITLCAFGSTFDRIDSKRIDYDIIDSDRIDFERIDLCLDTIM